MIHMLQVLYTNRLCDPYEWIYEDSVFVCRRVNLHQIFKAGRGEPGWILFMK